jgi:hypothetical protein
LSSGRLGPTRSCKQNIVRHECCLTLEAAQHTAEAVYLPTVVVTLSFENKLSGVSIPHTPPIGVETGLASFAPTRSRDPWISGAILFRMVVLLQVCRLDTNKAVTLLYSDLPASHSIVGTLRSSVIISPDDQVVHVCQSGTEPKRSSQT